jgi:hypothetical protein
MNPTNFLLFSPIRLYAVALTVLSSFLFSCEKDPEPLTTNSCITGIVYVDTEVLPNLPKVKITASGPYGSVSTFSEPDGTFLFENVGNGTYNLESSLIGYGSLKIYGIQVFGNDTAFAFMGTMFELADKSLVIPPLEAVNVVDHNISVKLSGTECPFTPVRFFMGKKPGVSCDNYEYSVISTNYFWACSYLIYLDNTPFVSGDKIYITGYVCNQNDQGYLDMYFNRLVFSTINKDSKSDVLNFIMP